MSRVSNDAKQQLLHPTPINQSIRCRLRFVLGPRGWMSRNHPHAHFLFYGGYLVIEQMVNYESGLAIVLLPCLRIPILSFLLATPISLKVENEIAQITKRKQILCQTQSFPTWMFPKIVGSTQIIPF